MPTTTRYFVSRRENGDVSKLVRIRQTNQGTFGEYWQAGEWYHTNRVMNYLVDPLAGDEISEPEADQIARDFGGTL